MKVIFAESIEAKEIYETYKEYLIEEKDANVAYERLYEYYLSSIEDELSLESILFWIVVAYFNWEYGIENNEVKQKALSIIDGSEIDNIKDGYFFFSNLDKIEDEFILIKETLLSENKKVKKLRKPRKYVNPWLPGDIFILKLNLSERPLRQMDVVKESDKYHINGKYIAFQKICDTTTYPKHICPVVAVFNWISDEKPTSVDIFQNIGFIETYTDTYRGEKRTQYLFSIEVESQMEMDNMNFEYLGNIPLLNKNAPLKKEWSNVNIVFPLSDTIYDMLYIHTEKNMKRYNPRLKLNIENNEIYKDIPYVRF